MDLWDTLSKLGPEFMERLNDPEGYHEYVLSSPNAPWNSAAGYKYVPKSMDTRNTFTNDAEGKPITSDTWELTDEEAAQRGYVNTDSNGLYRLYQAGIPIPTTWTKEDVNTKALQDDKDLEPEIATKNRKVYGNVASGISEPTTTYPFGGTYSHISAANTDNPWATDTQYPVWYNAPNRINTFLESHLPDAYRSKPKTYMEIYQASKALPTESTETETELIATPKPPTPYWEDGTSLTPTESIASIVTGYTSKPTVTSSSAKIDAVAIRMLNADPWHWQDAALSAMMP